MKAFKYAVNWGKIPKMPRYARPKRFVIRGQRVMHSRASVIWMSQHKITIPVVIVLQTRESCIIYCINFERQTVRFTNWQLGWNMRTLIMFYFMYTRLTALSFGNVSGYINLLWCSLTSTICHLWQNPLSTCLL